MSSSRSVDGRGTLQANEKVRGSLCPGRADKHCSKNKCLLFAAFRYAKIALLSTCVPDVEPGCDGAWPSSKSLAKQPCSRDNNRAIE
jgi:hypothetical protein